MFRRETGEGWRLLQMIAISVGFFDVISSLSPRAFHHHNLEAQIGRCWGPYTWAIASRNSILEAHHSSFLYRSKNEISLQNILCSQARLTSLWYSGVSIFFFNLWVLFSLHAFKHNYENDRSQWATPKVASQSSFREPMHFKWQVIRLQKTK